MPSPLAAERPFEFANAQTRDHREAVANSLPLSKNPRNQPKLDDLGAPSFAFFAKGGKPRTSTRDLFPVPYSLFPALSTARATRKAVPSFRCAASTCIPTGKPALVAPHGTVTPQMPAKLAVTV